MSGELDVAAIRAHLDRARRHLSAIVTAADSIDSMRRRQALREIAGALEALAPVLVEVEVDGVRVGRLPRQDWSPE